MKKTLQFKLTVGFSLLTALTSVGQGENNKWYFGNYAGVEFTAAGPVALTDGAIFAHDATATVSSADGNLLFYSDGQKIWNRNHQIMMNGSGLLGSHTSTHSSLIVPKPGSTSEYFVFTADRGGTTNNGLMYHVVDMNLGGGFGEVISKNNFLFGPVAEKLISVRHSNGQDVWVISHGSGSNEFKAFLVTDAGINTIPVVSAVGSFHDIGEMWARGQIKSSPDGTRLALAISAGGKFELFDFNSSNGQISNPVVLPLESNAYGVEFSPNNRYLYTARLGNGTIHQYDLQAGNSQAIIASKALIGTATVPLSGNNIKVAGLQLGPDGKVYVTKWDSPFLAVVSNPDQAGLQSGFIDDGIFLSGKTSFGGLSIPVMPNSIPTSTAGLVTKEVVVYPNPACGEVKVRLGQGFDSSKEINLQVHNILGQEVYSAKITYPETALNIKNWPAGVYQVRVFIEGSAVSTKLVVQ